MSLQSNNTDQNTVLDLKLKWLFIADCYRNAGDKLRAYEVAKELFTMLGENAGQEILAERYEYHQAQWDKFSKEKKSRKN